MHADGSGRLALTDRGKPCGGRAALLSADGGEILYPVYYMAGDKMIEYLYKKPVGGGEAVCLFDPAAPEGLVRRQRRSAVPHAIWYGPAVLLCGWRRRLVPVRLEGVPAAVPDLCRGEFRARAGAGRRLFHP